MGMTWRRHAWMFLSLLLLLPTAALAHHDHGDKGNRGLANVTVLIVRHAEKLASGSGLSPQGEQRAQAYATYFDPLRLDGQRLLPGRLIATADSKNSIRPRLTLTPLSQRLGLPIEQPYADADVDKLVKSLGKDNQAPVVLIAWHHGHIDKLIDAFGGDAKTITGRKTWPGDVYDWLVVLRFDANGQLDAAHSQLVQEHLLPGDGGG